jgi:hypothetical protein
MDILFHKLGVSVKHLTVLHQTLEANSPEYKAANDLVIAIGLEDFARQLYAGGKVGNNIERQMILADIFQYIFVGRGYFAAVESPQNMAKFIELLFRVANLLILQENLSVDPNLRRIVIEALETAISEGDFVEPGYDQIAKELESLKAYDGWIVGQMGKEFDNIFDSLLPKRVGLSVELLVFAMLLLKRYGYVVPLLMTQRLIRGGGQSTGKVDCLAPPDFLLLRDKGQIFGVEVGSGKDDQNAKFSLVTSIPLFPVRLGDHRQPQPYRCGLCGKWITYSSHVIKGLIAGTISPDQESINVDSYFSGGMPDVSESELVFYGDALDHEDKERTLRYHYNCVKEQEGVKRRLQRETRHHSTGVILPIPLVRGLENLRED